MCGWSSDAFWASIFSRRTDMRAAMCRAAVRRALARIRMVLS